MKSNSFISRSWRGCARVKIGTYRPHLGVTRCIRALEPTLQLNGPPGRILRLWWCVRSVSLARWSWQPASLQSSASTVKSVGASRHWAAPGGAKKQLGTYLPR